MADEDEEKTAFYTDQGSDIVTTRQVPQLVDEQADNEDDWILYTDVVCDEVTVVRWWFGGGLQWSTAFDRCWPPLTGGFGGSPGTAVMLCGITQAVTRGVLIIVCRCCRYGYEFHCCEYCGGPYYGSDCQTVNVFYEHAPYYNHDSSGFEQPSQFTPLQTLPLSELELKELITYMLETQEQFNINQEKFNLNVQAEINRLQEMLHLRNSNQDPPVDLYDLKGSYEGDMETDSLTKEPAETLLTNLECDMPVHTPLPTTDVRKEYFYINSPLEEQVVDFLMDNEDVASLPRHLVKQLFSHLVKNLSSTKRMSDEPLSDGSKPKSYDVTFSNPLFDFNDDFTLCNDNPLFDEEFEDISSMDPLKSGPLNHEPLEYPNLVSRSLKTSDLNLEELTAEIGLDDSITTEINYGYYDSEGDILFLKHLIIEETFSDPTPAVLLKKSTLLVTSPLVS
nr:NAC domain-containing protein [Tanacetum cinerariifolium]